MELEKKEKQGVSLPEINARELIIMSNLYLSLEYPFHFVTQADISQLLGCTKRTASSWMQSLERKGLVRKERGYEPFYYPVANQEMRQAVLERLGFSAKG